MLEREDPVNYSTLKYMADSPKHYRWRLAHPREDSEALQMGRVLHALVYEPDQVAARYVCEPRFNRTMLDTTAISKGYDGGKESAAAFAAKHASHEVIASDLWQRAQGMACALKADPISAPMIVGGYAEQAVRWTDSITGIEMRGRVDHINGRLSDLKSAREIDPRIFAAAAIRYGYHMQIAMYADGLAANGIVLTDPPCWIVVENTEPFDVVVFEIPDDVVAAGRKLYRRCLFDLKLCRSLDVWPGIAHGERQRIALPAWAAAPEEELALTMGGEALDL